MNTTPTELWPWLAIAGLGFFHGINPAMGWLFAVALGVHRGSRRVVVISLVPIALGHAAAVALVLALVLGFGLVLDEVVLRRAAAVVLIGWAVWHMLARHRQFVRVGMLTGMMGLGLWSFAMASAHGAGLMLVPVVLPLCLSASPARQVTADGSLPIALAAVGLHTAAMLATIAAVALIVHEWAGLAFLRWGWLNLDRVWSIALVVCGLVLLAA